LASPTGQLWTIGAWWGGVCTTLAVWRL